MMAGSLQVLQKLVTALPQGNRLACLSTQTVNKKSCSWLFTRCTHSCHLILVTLSKWRQQCQHREARKIFFRNPHILLSISFNFGYPVCFYFCSKIIDSSVPSWIKQWALVLEMSTMLLRQHGNGAVEVSFESRTAQMSALFHIFTCAFCLL